MKREGKVIFAVNGILTDEQIIEVREAWDFVTAFAVYLPAEPVVPNRLYGAQINQDGDAV